MLVVAAVGEASMGVALLLDPALLFQLLLGAEASGAGLALARLAGIALLGLSLACWPDRDARALRGALRAMLVYNALATAYLVLLGIGGEWVGVLLWPAVGAHAVLTLGCLMAFRRLGAPSGDRDQKAAAPAGEEP